MRPGVFAIVVWWMPALCVPAMGQRKLTASETKRYDKITNELVAPCCWRETISIHRSPEALEMLEQVRQFVAEVVRRKRSSPSMLPATAFESSRPSRDHGSMALSDAGSSICVSGIPCESSTAMALEEASNSAPARWPRIHRPHPG